jgi:predicted membrane chloride channel (bestrophin family)
MMLGNRRRLMLRVGFFVAIVILVKLGVHRLDWEFITVSPLFSGIVAANIFLMGFLLSGVLSDYKESERLPGELSAGLQNLMQEITAMGMAKPGSDVTPCLRQVTGLGAGLLDWFYRRCTTADLLDRLDALTPQFAAMESWAQAAMVARLKQEQGNLRRIVIRIETIRETSFVSAGYLLADMTTTILCLGLVLARIEPFYESLFFVGVISWLMIFLLLLIRDLDNPFGYYEEFSGADVSLAPLEAAVLRLEAASGGR